MGYPVTTWSKWCTICRNRDLSRPAGKFGGLWLDRSPEKINIGAVVRHTEPNFDLVECFNAEENTCPIGGVCTLKKVLTKASRQFMKELDQYTLADLVPNRKKLLVALGQA